ncbi:MAG: radical SAM protein [Nannocystaceae bacterium]|nr:radical SAM protein [Nannocystaceae bacterium]
MTEAAIDNPEHAGRTRQAEPSIEGRIRATTPRVHILTGAVCNNNCIFCMEEDRDGRYVTNSATSDDSVRWILENNADTEEVCFTSGEPTTNRALPRWVAMAKRAGVPTISVMTNGRALSYVRYAKGLVAAGMNKFYVSIHGHEKRLHDGLTRTPDSFEQTVAGLDVITTLKRYGVSLHTSTVITRRNLPHVAAIYRFLRAHGVDQVVFNVMQANGRANTYFDQLFPPYAEIAAAFAAFAEAQAKRERRVMAFLVDIPLCTTEAVPDFNRGYVERYLHFEPASSAHEVVDPAVLDSRIGGEDGGLVQIRRADLDDAQRQKRAECGRCRYDDVCEGVWGNYLRRYGWDEFVPVVSDVAEGCATR